MKAALDKAKDIAGGGSRLAEKLHITPQGVNQWSRVPSARVLDVEKITGVSRYELRPDLYGASPGDDGASSDEAAVPALTGSIGAAS